MILISLPSHRLNFAHVSRSLQLELAPDTSSFFIKFCAQIFAYSQSVASIVDLGALS